MAHSSSHAALAARWQPAIAALKTEDEVRRARRVDLAINYDGRINAAPVYESAWNATHIKMGTYHLWIDTSGRLRVKNGVPVSATDGTVVGLQT